MKNRGLLIGLILSVFIVVYGYAEESAIVSRAETNGDDIYYWDNPKLYDGSLFGEKVTVELVVDNIKQDMTGHI